MGLDVYIEIQRRKKLLTQLKITFKAFLFLVLYIFIINAGFELHNSFIGNEHMKTYST